MRSVCLLLVSLALSVVAPESRMEAQDTRLNLVRDDAYATRRIQVFKKSGGKLNSAVGIESFDADSNSFTMQEVTGETINVAISDLEKIEFEQALLMQNPVAQQGPFEVTALRGPTLRYNVPPGAIKIQSGDLILPASAKPTTISPITNTPSNPTAHHGGRLNTQKIVEAKKLTWDPSSKSFLVEVQEVVYAREDFGGSGLSGVRK